MATRKRITPEQTREMKRLWNKGTGWTLTEIGVYFGCDTSTVSRHVKPYDASDLRSSCRKPNKVSQATVESIIKMMDNKMRPVEVAKHVGIHATTVRNIYRRCRGTTQAQRSQRSSVPTGPLLVFVDREATGRGEDINRGRECVCWEARIDESALRKWRQHETWTSFDIADRLLIALDVQWWEVFDPSSHDKTRMFAWRQRDDVLAWMNVCDVMARLWTGEGLIGDSPLVMDGVAA
jgi:hypothetical protein